MKAIALLAAGIISAHGAAQDLGVAIGSQFGESSSLTAFAYGGTAPYTFAWSNGSSERKLLIDRPGRYTVVVTDAAGRTISTSTLVRRNMATIAERRELRSFRRRARANGELRVNGRDDLFSFGERRNDQLIERDGPSHRNRSVVP